MTPCPIKLARDFTEAKAKYDSLPPRSERRAPLHRTMVRINVKLLRLANREDDRKRRTA